MLLAHFKRPYLYALVKEECLYIGMTVDHPVFRWSNSIREGGSFYNAISKIDGGLPKSPSPIASAAYECREVLDKNLPYEEWRTTVCYAEHLLHVFFSKNRNILGPRVRVVSDTVRTAPRRCRHGWVDQMASRIGEAMVMELREIYGT